MWRWSNKLIFLFIVYFAGFATAIYCLAPVPDEYQQDETERTFAYSAIKSDEFARSFNSGMRKCVSFTKDAAIRAGDYLKERREQGHNTEASIN